MAVQQLQERREYPRMEFNRLVLLTDESGYRQSLIGVNYSVRGMALNSNFPLTFGEFVELQFWLIEPVKKEVSITAEIMQNFKEGEMYTTSVKFIGELSIN